jgi:hypothetical protein
VGALNHKFESASGRCEVNHAFGERSALIVGLRNRPGSILMLFLAAIVRFTLPRESESNDLLVQSRLGHAGLTVITLVYLLIFLWRQ